MKTLLARVCFPKLRTVNAEPRFRRGVDSGKIHFVPVSFMA